MSGTTDIASSIAPLEQTEEAAQQADFTAELLANNKMQRQTTLETFEQKLVDAVWKVASAMASDKIQ